MSRTTTDPATMLRPCPRCGLSKPLEAFGLDARGYARGYCRPCQSAATRASQALHRDELAERRRERYAAARLAGATSAEAKRAKDRRAIVPAVDTAPDTAGAQ